MGLDSTSEVAKIISDNIRETQDIKESYADQGDASFLLAPFDTLKATGELIVTKKVYKSDSFILDHPTLGVLDSATLKLDGGYDSAQDEVLVDKSF